jgi:hypothetical protein
MEMALTSSRMPVPLRIPGALGFAQSPVPDACLCSTVRILNRYVSRPLDRFLAGHGITITEFQLMVALQEGPARTLALARRLRLDPAPTGRALARLEQHGLVRREFPSWRFSAWILEPAGAIHLEMLEPGWVEVNQDLHWLLGPELTKSLVRLVDQLRYPVPRERQGWFSD